jgi:hypothetical protein
MHQNLFFTIQDVTLSIPCTDGLAIAQLLQNLFFTNPDTKKYHFDDHAPCCLAVCGNALELDFYHSRQ